MKKMVKKVVSKTAKKGRSTSPGKRVGDKPSMRTMRRKNPVKKITRYAIRVETPRGVQGYFSSWDNKHGPIFFTEASKAVKSTDKKLMENFANAIAEYKPKGIAALEVVIVGGETVKKN